MWGGVGGGFLLSIFSFYMGSGLVLSFIAVIFHHSNVTNWPKNSLFHSIHTNTSCPVSLILNDLQTRTLLMFTDITAVQ